MKYSKSLILAVAALAYGPELQAQGQVRKTLPPAARKIVDATLHIRKVTVNPGSESAVISFEAKANVTPVVEIRQGGNRIKTERPGGDRTSGKYSVTIGGLATASEYTYTIYVPSNDPRLPHFITGTFKTERGAATTAAKENLTDNPAFHIRNVIVTPRPDNVRFTFQGRPGIVPIVEIGKGPPRQNLDKRWEFRPEHLLGGYPAGGNKDAGSYAADISNVSELSQGTTYHYIVNAPSGDVRRPHQVTGTFSTQVRRVTLNFRRITVINDSDTNSAGDLTFNFWVNNELAFTLGGGGKPLQIETAGSYDVNREIVLENAPERLVIHVEGIDNDEDIFSGWAFGEGPDAGPTFFGPGKSSKFEWNVARRELDLSKEPKTWKHGIPSMSLGSSKSQLAFLIAVDIDNPTGK